MPKSPLLLTWNGKLDSTTFCLKSPYGNGENIAIDLLTMRYVLAVAPLVFNMTLQELFAFVRERIVQHMNCSCIQGELK